MIKNWKLYNRSGSVKYQQKEKEDNRNKTKYNKNLKITIRGKDKREGNFQEKDFRAHELLFK